MTFDGAMQDGPVITLTTDYGGTNYGLPVLKGTILTHIPNARIVDIGHEVKPFDIVEASFLIRGAYSAFPPGSIHLVSVYNFSSGERHLITFERDGHYFIGPNNGLFSLIFEDLNGSVFRIPIREAMEYPVHSTFAMAAKELSEGQAPSTIGVPEDRLVERFGLQAVVTSSQIRATVIYIDHYGNLVLNVRKELFDSMRSGRPFDLYFKRFDPIKKISVDDAEAGIGEVICRFNTAGYLEIGMNTANAQEQLGFRLGDAVQIEFNEDASEASR